MKARISEQERRYECVNLELDIKEQQVYVLILNR